MQTHGYIPDTPEAAEATSDDIRAALTNSPSTRTLMRQALRTKPRRNGINPNKPRTVHTPKKKPSKKQAHAANTAARAAYLAQQAGAAL